VERSYGSFTRSFQLPQGLNEEEIQASYNDGILSVRIPKTALPQPRKIQIGRQSQNQMSSGSQRQMGSGNGSSEETRSRGNTSENRETANGSKGQKSSRQTAGSNA
jgi:hypothetical protein